MRRTIVFAGGWLAAVVAGALLGMSVIGGSAAEAPLTPQDVTDALARGEASPSSPSPSLPSAAPPSPSPSSSAGTAATGQRRYFTSPGGTVWATCAGNVVTLSAVTPRQGYQIHDRQLG